LSIGVDTTLSKKVQLCIASARTTLAVSAVAPLYMHESQNFNDFTKLFMLNEAFQPSCNSIFPVCVQPLFANLTLQKTRKLNQLRNGGGVQISLQVVNS